MSRELFRYAWSVLLAFVLAPTWLSAAPLPADTTEGIHFGQSHNYASPSRQFEIARIDFEWAPTYPLPGSFNVYYYPYDRDSNQDVNGATLGHTLAWFKQNHPDWIVYTCNAGKYLAQETVPDSDVAFAYNDPGHVPLDVTNPAVLDYIFGTYLQPALQSGHFQAIGFDNLVFSNPAGRCGVWSSPTTWRAISTGRYDHNYYQNDIVPWARYMAAQIHQNSGAIAVNFLPNLATPTTTAISEDFLSNYADIHVAEDGMEQIVRIPGEPSISASDWQRFMEFEQKVASSPGKGLFMLNYYPYRPNNFYTDPIISHNVQWNLANYLLLKGAHTYFTLVDADRTEGNVTTAGIDWIKPEFSAPVGHAVAAPGGTSTAMYQSQGVWMRNYSNGLSIVNPDPVSIHAISLPTQKYKDLSGNPMGPVLTLPPLSGAVLLKSGIAFSPPACALTAPEAVAAGTPVPLSWTTTNQPSLGFVGVQLGALAGGIVEPFPALPSGGLTVAAPMPQKQFKYAMLVQNDSGFSVCSSPNVAATGFSYSTPVSLTSSWGSLQDAIATGGPTSFTITEGSATAYHGVDQYIGANGQKTWYFSVELSPVDLQPPLVRLGIMDSENQTLANVRTMCDLSGQTAPSATGGSSQASGAGASGVLLPDGWYRCSLSGSFAVAPARLRLYIELVGPGGVPIFAGNGSSKLMVRNVRIWGGGQPTVVTALQSPLNGATVDGVVAVSASARSHDGVSQVSFTLDNMPLGAPQTAAPYSTAWNTFGASNGLHTIAAVARDTKGNASTSAVSVNVSNLWGKYPRLLDKWQVIQDATLSSSTAPFTMTEGATKNYHGFNDYVRSNGPLTWRFSLEMKATGSAPAQIMLAMQDAKNEPATTVRTTCDLSGATPPSGTTGSPAGVQSALAFGRLLPDSWYSCTIVGTFKSAPAVLRLLGLRLGPNGNLIYQGDGASQLMARNGRLSFLQ